MMQVYRKKIVKVEAVEFAGTREQARELCEVYFGELIFKGIQYDHIFVFHTAREIIRLVEGDYLVKIGALFFSCTKEKFEAEYILAAEAAD